VWLYAPGILNFVQPPQVAPASRSKLAANPRSVSLRRYGERFALAGDTRDLLAARDSLKQLLGLSQLDG
jgi:hypothetical protein